MEMSRVPIYSKPSVCWLQTHPALVGYIMPDIRYGIIGPTSQWLEPHWLIPASGLTSIGAVVPKPSTKPLDQAPLFGASAKFSRPLVW